MPLCCAAIILFLNAATLVGAVLLRAIYFRYGMVIAIILLGVLLFIMMRWGSISFIKEVIGIGAYILIAVFILSESKLLLLVSIASYAVTFIGVYLFLPLLLFLWICIAIYSWKKGNLNRHLTELLFIRLLIAASLLIPAGYAAGQYAPSLDFTLIDHKSVGAENYYSVTRTSLSSDTTSGTITVQYKCNEISVFCHEVSSPK